MDSKTAIQAVKKGVAQFGSPAQDGQGEEAVKYRWLPRNGCDGRLWQKLLITTVQVNFCPYPSFTRNQHKIYLDCCY